MSISKVALAGKGRLGSVVVDELLKAGFKVSVLTRSSSSLNDVPAGVEIHEVDYTSQSILQAALNGVDAVVSTVAGVAVSSQKPLIDAAIAAGVKHFIPADYAMSLRAPEVRRLPPYTDVLGIENYLRAHAQTDGNYMAWTVVACGGFLEYSFDLPFMIDLPNRAIDRVNGGEVSFSISEFRTVSRAIVGVLREPERVVEHCVQVHGMLVTQNQVLGIAKKYSSDPESWVVNEKEADVRFEEGMDMLRRGEFTMQAVSTLMAGVIWDPKYETGFKETDNEWLGIETIPNERLEETIKDKLLSGVSGIASDKIVSNV
ncbi:NmrA-like family protein [Aspergillus pseudodeflectus]|uniref:NmrA-like family protein n=1 Tax=Aspergillus pseudodeflectus TaxID=176178 RepID=A0ABR4JAY9_9EURO